MGPPLAGAFGASKSNRAARPVAVAVASLLLLAGRPHGAEQQRLHLWPRFAIGQTLHYQIETRATTNAKATTPIENPEGPSQFRQAVSLIVRLDVLDAQVGREGTTGPTKIRATYEKSAATFESDAFDPQAALLQGQYDRLEGRSLEFTIEPDGKLSSLKGIEDVLANPSAAGAARAWLSELSSGAAIPKRGIAVSEKWSGEQLLPGTPLAGMVWRTESTYLRNEPCRAEDAVTAETLKTDAAAGTVATCAVILTRFNISRGGQGDATPEDYRRNGLRTSGTWTGSGESLDSISISTGLLISSTQTSSQEMNYEIVSASSGSKMRYAGRVESQSQITLLPEAPPS